MENTRNLFICASPLQSLIAGKIMELEDLQPKECALYFYSSVNNKKVAYYYNELSDRCGVSVFHHCTGTFHHRIGVAKKLILKINYENVYAASINSVYVQLALSLKKKKRLYTFDDGCANLSPGSRYNTTYGHSLKKHLASRLFGNTYSIDRIKTETIQHYTIYPGYNNNVSDKLIPIELFDGDVLSNGSGQCAVVLGTVFDEAFGLEAAGSLVEKLGRFMASLGQDVYYIPHPRDRYTVSGNHALVEIERIAEDIVIELLGKHRRVDLYGFCSSAQINLEGIGGLKNYFLSSSAEKGSIVDMRKFANEVGIMSEEAIDIDPF